MGEGDIGALGKGVKSDLGIQVRVIRPGPLVSYSDFEPPGDWVGSRALFYYDREQKEQTKSLHR